ncbi:ribose-binding protein [Scopulibacillus darangshiensis]|uniref:Ribose-binding protein n=1 Tax=Scopulibacillus darangshiensis TaxID=442528 RepID=A0A4R2NUA6_9BACL|nr:ribose ABC transporter substrate-binding protein RbsB [Scopulibacillus darangshiensis]TCP24965.1 ribose-binding protein [Scopulibacillus darangshiensis]
MGKYLKSLVFGLLCVVLLAGCSTKPPGSDSEKKGSNNELKIGFSVSTLNNPFFVSLKEGAKEAAKKDGYKLITVSAQDDSAKQANDIEDLIQKNVDVLLINPTDSSAVAGAVKSANDAGIPVITVDRKSDKGKIATHIASNNVEGGKMAAKFLIDQLNGKGNVVELQGVPGSSAANERGKGFDEAIKDAKGIKVIAKQPADFNRSKGLSVMENIIQTGSDIDAVFAQNDEMALGAIVALKEAGLKDVKVIGFDGTKDGIQAVKDGKMAATIAQKPKLIGQKAIDAAKKAADGKDLPKFIPVELKLVK